MDLRIYRQKLRNEGLAEAAKYKNNFVPNVLYKYSSLLDDRFINYKEENQKRLDTLNENKLWVSHYIKFNDPFEFKMLAIDQEKLKGTGWEVEDINK